MQLAIHHMVVCQRIHNQPLSFSIWRRWQRFVHLTDFQRDLLGLRRSALCLQEINQSPSKLAPPMREKPIFWRKSVIFLSVGGIPSLSNCEYLIQTLHAKFGSEKYW